MERCQVWFAEVPRPSLGANPGPDAIQMQPAAFEDLCQEEMNSTFSLAC